MIRLSFFRSPKKTIIDPDSTEIRDLKMQVEGLQNQVSHLQARLDAIPKDPSIIETELSAEELSGDHVILDPKDEED